MNVEDLFKQSIKDGVFSKTERHSIEKYLSEAHLSKHQLNRLRNNVFDIAKEQLEHPKMKQVLQWIKIASKLIEDQIVEKTETQCYFSPGEDCLQAILTELKQATRTVDVCVFTITDNRIYDALLDCFTRKIKLRVITDNEKSDDRGSDVYALASKGVPVKVDETKKHMHHKFMIVDQERVLTGSYNWTRSAAAFNEENIIITNDKRTVNKFTTEFSKLWESFYDYFEKKL